MKIEVQPVGDCTVLIFYVSVHNRNSVRETAAVLRLAEALTRKQHSLARALGLQTDQPVEHFIPGYHLLSDHEASFSLTFYHFTARKDARKLRTRLLEEMILFTTMHRNLFKWARGLEIKQTSDHLALV